MKITITIEDLPDGVRVISDPSFGEMMRAMTERQPTPAETYAQSMLNKARDMSKQSGASSGAAHEAKTR